MSTWTIIRREPDSAEELDRIAKRLLRGAGVGDQLPTPQGDIIDCAELAIGGEIDLDDFKDNFFDKLGRAFYSGWKKLRGILDVRQRTIYIKGDVPESQMPFLRFHEVAHKVVPWQIEMYEYFGDDSYTLSPEVEEMFDQEANYLSARLLFQCDRLEKEARDFKLSLSTAIKFAETYGSSYHSTFWYYAATNAARCVVLVLKECRYYEIGKDGSEKPYYLQYAVPSERFTEEFGEIQWKRRFNSDHPFTAVVHDLNSPEIYEGEVKLENRNGEIVVLNFEAWSNTYNIFVLIYKKRRISFPKKKVSLLDRDRN